MIVPAVRQHPRFRLPAVLARLAIAMAALLITVYSQWMTTPGVPWFADEWLRDRFVRMQTTTTPEPRILVVDVDEASLKQIGAWPWDHARIADMVELLLTHYGAKGVALDIVLEKSDGGSGDQRLKLMAEHGTLVLAQAFDYEPNQALRGGVPAGATTRFGNGGVPATGHLANDAWLAHVENVGNIGYLPDADGALRRIPLLTRFEGKTYPALALALLKCCSGAPLPNLESSGVMRVAFKRDWSAVYIASAAEILNQAIAADSGKDRYVLIGSSSLTLGDRVTTPLGEGRPGLGVQASVLATLLDRQQGLAPTPWPGKLLACLFAALAAAIATFAFPRLSAAYSVLLLGAIGLAWLVVAYFATQHDPLMVPTGPVASILFLLAVAVPYQWQLTQRRSRHLLGTLRQYVAPEVVSELLRSDLADPLLPRRLDVTTLIADMEGYTTAVESLTMEEASDLTRDFLDCLTGPVIAHRGTLDKYTGDGLVAFWGAPLPVDEHADMALDAALAITARVEAFSRVREQAGQPRLRVRIGIESGQAMAGDFGTSFRSIYTAVGDSVNTAARLEQAARDFSHNVIIGAGTVSRARRHHFLLLGERLLRGKEKPTTLYTFDPAMLDMSDNANSSTPLAPAA